MATAPPADRRPLHFTRVDDALTDVDQLAAADAAGTLATSGHWTFGQSLNHLATWVDSAYDGLPMDVPLPVRVIMLLM